MLIVTAESTTGTADEAAAARDNGTALRSEQIVSKMRWVKTKPEPVVMSVADVRISGPVPRDEFQRHRLAKFQIVGSIDLAHSAAPDERNDSIASPENCSGGELKSARFAVADDDSRRFLRRAIRSPVVWQHLSVSPR